MVLYQSKVSLLPLLFSTFLPAQSTPALPQLSPQSAYDQVMRPLEITRRSVGNWSDSELNALGIAIKQAAEACAARTPEQFTGDDLIAYARLCALGQQWPTVILAADRYINSTDPAKPQLDHAYAYQVNATLHTNDPKAILADSLAMLNAVPYTSLTDETLYDALHYLQLAFTPEALTLYAAREHIVLAALQNPKPSTTAADAPVSIATLYGDGLAFAALQQFAGDTPASVKTRAELDAALPTSLQPDDSIPIAEARRQYDLLGSRLPAIPLNLSLYSVGETPRINANYGASTVLLLFPEWCAQCVRMAQQMVPTLFRISGSEVHLYGLLAQLTPPVITPHKTQPKTSANTKPATTDPSQLQPVKTAAELLRGTPTLIVPLETLSQFAATDFPLLIATDPKGIIRFIQPVSDTALNPGDLLDQITAHIATQWPRSAAANPAPRTSLPHP